MSGSHPDHEHSLRLVQTLAHHDAAITALGGRMQNVEVTLDKLQSNINDLDSKLGEGFARVEGLFQTNKAQQGPKLGEIMTIVAVGGSIVAMTAGAITMLVTSFVAPEMTTLKDTTTVLSEDHKARVDQAREELYTIKKEQQGEIKRDVDVLKSNLSEIMSKLEWATRVERERK